MKPNTKLQRLLAGPLLAGLLFTTPTATVFADPAHSAVAGAGAMAASKPVGSYGMFPVPGQCVKDGDYDIETDVSSKFFRIESATLHVRDGEMTATVQLDTFTYSLIYNGSSEAAAAADYAEYLEVTEDEEGYASFTLPVSALNQQFVIASYSDNKNQWYNRTILFDAGTLPADALTITLPDYEALKQELKDSGIDVKKLDAANTLTPSSNAAAPTTQPPSSESGAEETADAASATDAANPEIENTAEIPADPMEMDLKDGEYAIEVTLAGGTGRASVTSPTLFFVEDGKAYAKLYWSSTYYDYMIVAGERYDNQTTDGGASTFVIPVTSMDQPMSVIADTTAMGEPVEINYQLTFYRETIGDKNQVPQIAARRVLVVAGIIIAVGAVLSYLTRKRRYR